MALRTQIPVFHSKLRIFRVSADNVSKKCSFSHLVLEKVRFLPSTKECSKGEIVLVLVPALSYQALASHTETRSTHQDPRVRDTRTLSMSCFRVGSCWVFIANTFFSSHQQSVLQSTTFRPGCPSHFQLTVSNRKRKCHPVDLKRLAFSKLLT